MHILRGRIAQLVELLSYTQAVIGSSPVAPIQTAGVVQLVRAPPCHGGSCGFEPRLPRFAFTSKANAHGNSFFLLSQLYFHEIQTFSIWGNHVAR